MKQSTKQGDSMWCSGKGQSCPRASGTHAHPGRSSVAMPAKGLQPPITFVSTVGKFPKSYPYPGGSCGLLSFNQVLTAQESFVFLPQDTAHVQQMLLEYAAGIASELSKTRDKLRRLGRADAKDAIQLEMEQLLVCVLHVFTGLFDFQA